MTDQEEDLRAAWQGLIHLRWYDAWLAYDIDGEEKAHYRCRRWRIHPSDSAYNGLSAHDRLKIYGAFRRAWASRHLKDASA
ncbi:MAG TPA: hypothetical protein HPQ04_01000 [Rhodospirillaceae bacterium]|nr:hypothetical protein [Rhodospirillaceae bacterium]